MRLYRQSPSGPWWLTHGDGPRRVRVSTGERDYDRAQEAARRILAPLLLDAQAARVEAAAATARGLRAEASAMRGAGLSWDDAWERLASSESRWGRPRAASTLADYRARWGRYADAMQALGHERPADVPERDAAAWVASHGARSRVVCWQVLGMAYRACGLPSPAGRRPRHPASEVTHRDPLTADQVAALLDEPRRWRAAHPSARLSPEYGLLLRVLVYTGLRLGDAATLRVGQVDLAEGVVARRAGKTGAELRLPMHPDLLYAVRDAIPQGAPPDAYIMPRMAALYLSPHDALTRRITALMSSAGIPRAPGRHCAHCLRTTFAAMCAEAGVPMGVIQGWLGHASQEVTRIYARVEDMRARRAALAKLPAFPSGQA